MNQKSKLDEIDYKVEKLIQLQDFSTIQTAFLAILFAILIFVTTIILYYKDQNILVWIVAHIILAYDIMMLYWLFFSIFSGDVEAKFRNFGMLLFYLVLSGSIVLVMLIFFSINSMFSLAITTNNTIVVVMLSSAMLLTIFLDKFVEKKYYERFKFLSGKDKEKRYEGMSGFVKKIIKKYRKYIFYSVTVGLFIAIFSGLLEWTSLRTANENYYGFPLTWMIEHVDKIPRLNYNYGSLFGNWLIYTTIIFVFLLAYIYFARFVDKKTNLKHLGKTESKQKDKIQNAENWENNPAFVEYKK